MSQSLAQFGDDLRAMANDEARPTSERHLWLTMANEVSAYLADDRDNTPDLFATVAP